jgi:hypothetical protein
MLRGHDSRLALLKSLHERTDIAQTSNYQLLRARFLAETDSRALLATLLTFPFETLLEIDFELAGLSLFVE